MTGSSGSNAQTPAHPLAAVSLDPYSGEQIYRQLYRGLRGLILSGAWGEGEIIPSENEMRDHFAVARTTVRHALSLLVHEGLVAQVRGKGTIVSHRAVSHSVWNFGSFTDLARSNGKRPVTRVMEHRIDDGVLLLVRARGLASASAAGEAVDWLNLDTSWLPLAQYPGIETYDFALHSLYAVLRENYSRVPVRSEIHLTVVPPTPGVIDVFGHDPAIAGYLCATGDVIDAHGDRVERTSIIYSPRVEMKFATRWGQAEPAPLPGKGD